MIGDDIMYVCLDCGCIFSEPKNYVETHGFSTPPYEKWSGCPNCNGAYTEAYECGCCDEWIDGTYIKLEDGERICENCYTTYELGDED